MLDRGCGCHEDECEFPEGLNRGNGRRDAETDGNHTTPALTILDAARVCGVSRKAIRRAHASGEFLHSFKDAEGTWRVPFDDLIEAGFRPYVVPTADAHLERALVERLRLEVAVLRERLRATEAVARERQLRIEDLRLVLRMLPSPSSSPARGAAPGPAGSSAMPRVRTPARMPAPAPARRGLRAPSPVGASPAAAPGTRVEAEPMVDVSDRAVAIPAPPPDPPQAAAMAVPEALPIRQAVPVQRPDPSPEWLDEEPTEIWGLADAPFLEPTWSDRAGGSAGRAGLVQSVQPQQADEIRRRGIGRLLPRRRRHH
jgi:hypothetical protein